MRIVAGKWRGTRLLPPPTEKTRPILDRVKVAIFDLLGAKLALPGQLPPLAVLDLFAGTGSMGLEAVSRGASECLFVEKHRPTADILQANIDKLQSDEIMRVLRTDAWRLDPPSAASRQPFELVFVDPPYSSARTFEPASSVCKLMAGLHANPTVHDEALIVFRHPKDSKCEDDTFENLQLTDQRSYGDMTISFLTPQR